MLELVNVCFSVKEKGRTKDILKNINLKIEDDKFFVITGPNGSGKSTLAKIIMGINKVTSGKILFNGEDITDLGVTERAKLGISFAFQQPVRFKGITVKRMIELATGGEINVGEACKYLADVGLCARDYIDREVDTSLSGGEVKRVEIASIMARELGLAIFDEPEAGIDLWSFTMLVETFKVMKNKRNQSIVLISHQERIMSVADRIIVIASGRITGTLDARTATKEEIGLLMTKQKEEGESSNE